jgi:preprotein translocase subunit SecG
MVATAAKLFQVSIAILLVSMIGLTLLTLIATDKSHSRTACLNSASSLEECPVPSGWEKILRRIVG